MGLVPDESGPGAAAGEPRGLVGRLRGVIEAKDAENAALRAGLAGLRAELEAERELVCRLELRVAELERRLRMDSSDSGMPSSKEPLGAKERRRAGGAGSSRSGSGARTASRAGSPATRAAGCPGTLILMSAPTPGRRRSARGAGRAWLARGTRARRGRRWWTSVSRGG